MSSSMSPPPQRPSPAGYSPSYQNNAPSPSNAPPFGQPPAKRQRLSPDPRSPPNGQPTSYPTQAQPQNGGPVTSAYGNPYAPQNAPMVQSPQNYAAGSQASFHTPQPYPFQQMPWQSQASTPNNAQTPGGSAAGRQGSPPSHPSREMMPPPPRPNPVREEREEKIGVDEIGDSLFGSGINLKDEENYMHTVYNNRHSNDNYGARQNQSFNSNASTLNNSFNSLTQETPTGSQERNGSFAGTMGRPRSQEEIEIEDRKKREAAATARAERMQHHLNNQFLQCNNVRKRMDRIARNHGVMLNLHGLSVKQSETKAAVNGNGTAGIVATNERVRGVKNEDNTDSSVAQGAPFEHLMALVSLAAGERLRGLLDESHALARARRYGDHGRVVPPEFADIAEGEGKTTEERIIPQNISGSQWDKTGGGISNIDMQDGEKEKSAAAESQATIAFQDSVSASLRAMAERDRQAEKARIKKREARKRAAAAPADGSGANGDSSSTAAGTPADGNAAGAEGGDSAATTTAATTTTGPAEAAAPVKVSKKEQAKQQKEKNNMEAQSHNTVNRTAMLAMGKKGRQFSWMTGGSSNLPTNRYAKPGTSGSATPSGVKSEARSPAAGAGGGAAGAGTGAAAAVAAEAQWGDWREDGAGGKGVQLRDLVFVLERDGRERVALEKAMAKLS